MIWLGNWKQYISMQLILVFTKKMRRILIYTFVLISLFSFAKAENGEEIFSPHEEDIIIELDKSDIPTNPTQEQRDIRYNQKQEIKSRVLWLYKDLKEEKNKDEKKEIRYQISYFKKELWKINAKIAHSYKQQFKRFFWLK